MEKLPSARKLHSGIFTAKIPEAYDIAVDFKNMIRDSTYNIGEAIHATIISADYHGTVFTILQGLPFLYLSLDSGAKGVIDGPHHVNFTVSYFVYISDRTVVDRMYESNGKLISITDRIGCYQLTRISVF